MNLKDKLALILAMSLSYAACTSAIPPAIDDRTDTTLAVGRVLAVVTGNTSRMYQPAVRSFEVEEEGTHERFTVDVQSEDQYFAVALPAGRYRLNRVQISEGPFLSMADLHAAFSVERHTVNYVGTWRFGVESPRYGRMLALSMVMDDGDRSGAEALIRRQYPSRHDTAMAAALPEPTQMEARLYEVMPYPRYPTYFRRHLW